MTLLLPAHSVTTLDTVWHTDLITLCNGLGDASIDMILTDVPYGTTACAWDEVIPFEPMWAAFKRVIKPRGAIVMTASQPFTSALVTSNPKMYRHGWVWNKGQSGSFHLAKYQPLKVTEDVLVFGVNSINYYPQMERRGRRLKSGNNGSDIADGLGNNNSYLSDMYFPTNILYFSNSANKPDNLHPTQKPVALFEYLIRTYTRVGDVVLDPCVGSGTTAIAARQCGRHYIVGDSSAQYVEVARRRLAQDYTLPMFESMGLAV